MDSPLARVILATLAGYLTILLALSIYDWIAEEYPRRPIAPTHSARVHHPFYHRTAVSALQQFARLPELERTAIKASLESHLVALEQWLALLERSRVQIVCMGELHQESTRRFLAERFFANIRTNVLLLEATHKQSNRLIKRMEAGREYFPLLDADIMAVLRTVKARNPDIRFVGIEETAQQARMTQGTGNARDQSIADNFWNAFEPGLRHIILFGALHCTNAPNWLFQNLYDQASPTLRNAMLNVRVLGVHQDGPLEAFVYFADAIALARNHFVIPDTRLLHPRIYEWFPHLNQATLNQYRTLIVFRE